jgi:hypothetical protein
MAFGHTVSACVAALWGLIVRYPIGWLAGVIGGVRELAESRGFA